MPQNPSTPEEQIEYLATKVMGWAKETIDADGCLWHFWTKGSMKIETSCWNPLKDWCDWHQVETAMRHHQINGEDSELWATFIIHFDEDIVEYMEADLPNRVSALISAHQSLGNES